MLTKRIAFAAAVLALCAAPVIGQQPEGFWFCWFHDPGAADPSEPVGDYPVGVGETFPLDLYGFGLVVDPVTDEWLPLESVWGYSLDFFWWTDRAIGFNGYADARGWPATPASFYPLLEYRTDGLPLLPPAEEPFALGTIYLTAPPLAGEYPLELSSLFNAPETSVLYLSPLPSKPGIACEFSMPVTLVVAGPPPLPPIAPVDYTASVEALFWNTTTVNRPADAHEEDWGAGPMVWPATADAFADLTQTGDTTVLKMTISGESGWEEWWEEPGDPGGPGWQEPIPTNASGEVTGTVRVGENGDYPAGTPLELLILVNQRTTWTGDNFQWSCQVEHGNDLVVFDAANTDPVTWAVLAGDELAVSAWMSDESWSGGFVHSLEVSFITLPEPATLAIVGLGLAGCLALRRRK